MNLAQAFERDLVAHVEASPVVSKHVGPRAMATALIEDLEAWAASDERESARAYAAAMREVYTAFGAQRTFKVLAREAWRYLVGGAPLLARDAFRRVWEPEIAALEQRAHELVPKPLAKTTPATTPAAAPAVVNEDAPWWQGWGDRELERWLDEVAAVDCEVLWNHELGRPRILIRYAFAPPWVYSDAWQLRELLGEYFTRARRAA